MNPAALRIAFKSFFFYNKTTVNQIIIIGLLAAVITGSLFTGYSVRNSLKSKSAEKLGNTDILISSGLRYFNFSLSERIARRLDQNTVSLIETDGYAQNFSTGSTALNVKIFGIENDFFSFQGNDSLSVTPGTVAVNEKLADHLEIRTGDEIIIRFKDVDPLPANAPFAPSKVEKGSVVMKVGMILKPYQSGNFSLGISQIVPMNIFIRVSDLKTDSLSGRKANRLLVQNIHNYPDSVILGAMKGLLTVNDIGLSLRKSRTNGQTELISDRIFIDSSIVYDVLSRIPSGWPVITYLANSISLNGRETPYSFVTALPPSAFREIKDDEIVISSWLAEDIGAGTGDSLKLTWFDPASGRLLKEKSKEFTISTVLERNSELSDPDLMPDFPGISGSTTCSGWDAGVPLLLDKIREKDEEYWNKYRGTPKAFISYSTGKKLWGNNFGPATAIRFPEFMSPDKVARELAGSLDPSSAGFTVSDIRKESRDAAEGGVDFSMLFISLGIFVILSCIILLSLSVSMFLNSRKEQVRTYYALGFRNIFIKKLLLTECLLHSLAGAIPGIFMGYFINFIIINALNSVWQGAVQTDTLSAAFGILPLVSGFFATVMISGLIVVFKIRSFLKDLVKSENVKLPGKTRQRFSMILLIVTFFIAALLLLLTYLLENAQILLSFISGTLFFLAFILVLRFYYTFSSDFVKRHVNFINLYSRKYYSFNPSQAITPVIFIAAGIFAIIITGANRQVINRNMLLPAGGTGGYQLWMETAVPVKEDLDQPSGRKEFGFDEAELKDLKFVQALVVSGDDASCLNLNHVTSPPLLGVNAQKFISKGSFSFAKTIVKTKKVNPWDLLNKDPGTSTIYGMADQTVLQWGLKTRIGDTLKYHAENGQLLNIVICAGLKSSVFQGYLIISERNLSKYFPSVEGSTVFLLEGNPGLSDKYKEILKERFSGYGPSIVKADDKLASFFEVTNTYLDVFTVLGVFGMILGVVGMGFILIRNFNQRKREFALMMASGYSIGRIRKLLLSDQVIILLWGVMTGTICGLISTLPSLISGSDIPWNIIILMVAAVISIGFIALLFSVRIVKDKSLVMQLRRE